MQGTIGVPEPGGATSFAVLINEGEFEAAPVDLMERAVRLALGDSAGRGGELSVTLLSDGDIQTLNRDYLSRDRPTDVIAFSLGESDALLGDVYIGFDQASRQAEELGVDLREELARLAIHGTLHVMGYDHPEGTERDASPMFELQERLVGELLGDAREG
jgi:probable rRNA maturation factor